MPSRPPHRPPTWDPRPEASEGSRSRTDDRSFREGASFPWTFRPGERFPRTVRSSYNLREVAPGLYVGDAHAVEYPIQWGLVVDLYGSSASPGRRHLYPANRTLHRPMLDGDEVSPDLLDELVPEVGEVVMHGRPALIHCQAGLSRSASVAYGLLRVGWGLAHEEARRRVLTPAGVEGGFPRRETFDSVRRWADHREPVGQRKSSWR